MDDNPITPETLGPTLSIGHPLPPELPERRYQNLVIVSLALSTLFMTVFNRFRPKNWLPDSAVNVFCGIAVGFLLGTPDETDLLQDLFTNIFFDICMPPIAFAAALNESRASLGGIIFAIAATSLTTFLIGQALQSHFTTEDNGNGCLVRGCMVWGVVMAPVNARYVLTSHYEKAHIQGDENLTFEEEEEIEAQIQHPLLPKHKSLDSWLNCEALLAGPIALVFYTSLRQDRLRGLDLDPQQTFLNFLHVLLGSAMLGTFIGMFSALSLRTPFQPTKRGGPYREVSLILLWAFAAFFLAKYLYLSPVGTLFCTGIVMKSTAIYVVSVEARHASRVGSEAVASAAESFMLLYMGIASISMLASVKYASNDTHALFLVLGACILSRIIIACFVSLVLGGGGYRFFTFLVALLSGMRGVVTFSMALKTGLEVKDIVAIASAVAIFSHTVMGPALALFIESQKPKVPESSSPRYPKGGNVLSSRGAQYESISLRA